MFSRPLLKALTAFGKKCENILGYEAEFRTPVRAPDLHVPLTRRGIKCEVWKDTTSSTRKRYLHEWRSPHWAKSVRTSDKRISQAISARQKVTFRTFHSIHTFKQLAISQPLHICLPEIIDRGPETYSHKNDFSRWIPMDREVWPREGRS
jgi:hypothetical protein